MGIEKLFPYAGDNAIQNAVFALEWSNELSPRKMLEIQGSLGSMSKALGFTKSQIQNLLTINLSDAPSVVSGGAGEIGGIVFERSNALGNPVRTLNISRPQCLGIAHEYSRWNNVWKEIRTYFEAVVELIDVPINAIGLQYTDLFTWKGAPEDLMLNEVFNQGSLYIPPHAFSLTTLWHSHHGYFVDNPDNPYRLLNNVNLNVLDNGGVKSIQIVTSHKAILREPCWYKKDENHLMDLIDNTQSQLHAANKDILKDLLTEQVRQKIGLT